MRASESSARLRPEPVVARKLWYIAIVPMICSYSIARGDEIPACTEQTLAAYIALKDGCFVGDKVFSGFAYEAAAQNPSAEQVDVDPRFGPPNSIGVAALNFATLVNGMVNPWNVPANETETVATLDYEVDVIPGGDHIFGANLFLGMTTGGVDVQERLVPPGVTLEVLQNKKFVERNLNPPISGAFVHTSIVLTGGPKGAEFTEFDEGFREVAPEPTPRILVITGLVLLAVAYARTKNPRPNRGGV